MALYIVATPIGNLEDITFRAVDTLKRVQFILAEDTRVTGKLLKKYDIRTQLVSYRDQNHENILPKVKEKLDMGLDLALVSDAGTPTLSDPGFKLVRELREEGYEIYSIPGAFAGAAALSISGLPTDKFLFLGFLPKSGGKREAALKVYGDLDCSILLYESPNRIVQLLKEISKMLGDKRKIFIASELTKLFEKHWYGTASELIERFDDEDNSNLKGEFTVVIGKDFS
jgi:16S rRNA (cytidine1402-2'-O)-methyltransferase